MLRNHRAIFGLFVALTRDSALLSLYGRTVQLLSRRIVSEDIVDDCLCNELSIICAHCMSFVSVTRLVHW